MSLSTRSKSKPSAESTPAPAPAARRSSSRTGSRRSLAAAAATESASAAVALSSDDAATAAAASAAASAVTGDLKSEDVKSSAAGGVLANGDGVKRVWGVGRNVWVERIAAGTGRAFVDISRASGVNVIDIETDSTPPTVRLSLSHSAFVIVDLQNSFTHPNGRAGQFGHSTNASRALFPAVNEMIGSFRSIGVPIVWVNWGNRSDRANLPPGLLYSFGAKTGTGIGDPLPKTPNVKALIAGNFDTAVDSDLHTDSSRDIFVDKYRMSGFHDTPLDSILRNAGITTLFFAGVNLDQCVFTSMTDANFLGYDCILLKDCAATSSPAYCTDASYYNVTRCLGFVCDTKRVIKAMKTARLTPPPVTAATATAATATIAIAASAVVPPSSPVSAKSDSADDRRRQREQQRTDMHMAMLWLCGAMLLIAFLAKYIYESPVPHQYAGGAIGGTHK